MQNVVKLFTINFMIFVLSKFKIKLLAEKHLMIWERKWFGTEQKLPKFMLEIMTLVS